LYPYIHSMSHHRSPEHLVRCVSIPDKNVSHEIKLSGSKGRMSMVAGDFSECYSSPADAETFSVIVTIFFIDTAPNVLKYLETIHNVLETNGVWINLGPLAWHFEADSNNATHSSQVGGTIELTLSELLCTIEKMGFKFESGNGLDRCSISMPYMANDRGMLTYVYNAEFWVARKV
jgi:carnosine N-methyltransferase